MSRLKVLAMIAGIGLSAGSYTVQSEDLNDPIKIVHTPSTAERAAYKDCLRKGSPKAICERLTLGRYRVCFVGDQNRMDVCDTLSEVYGRRWGTRDVYH